MSGPRRRRSTPAGTSRAATSPAPSNGRTRKARPQSRNAPAAARQDLWGASAGVVPPAEALRITTDPAAVVRSLGRPPLTGHEVVAEHYLRAVYERAVGLGRALAAVGDLIEADDAR